MFLYSSARRCSHINFGLTTIKSGITAHKASIPEPCQPIYVACLQCSIMLETLVAG